VPPPLADRAGRHGWPSPAVCRPSPSKVSSSPKSPRSPLPLAHLARNPGSPEHQHRRPPEPPEGPCSLTSLDRGRRKEFLQEAPCKVLK
jgi:hypothetical protein